MTRSGFKRLWMLVFMVLIIASYMIYQKTTDKQFQIDSEMRVKDRLTWERESSKELSKRLELVDTLTMHEPSATLLDILRYIGIEENPTLEYSPTTKTVQNIMGIDVYERNFVLKGEMPYMYAMAQLDSLYENERITVNGVKVTHVNKPGNIVLVEVDAKIFSLDKGAGYEENTVRRKR